MVVAFGRTRFARCCLSSCALLALSIGEAAAAPQGASYNRGQVTVTQAGSQTIVNQSVDRAIIDWQSFDVDRNEGVRFNQPGAGSATLNRVTAGRESVIAGRISAPGEVIIENSNGVVFTGTAHVDVGALVATSSHLSNENFAKGRLKLDPGGNPDAVVSNAGTITIADRGLAAFVAPAVANSGTITARLGTVALAAGTAATIDLYGDGLVSVAVTDPVTRKPRGIAALVNQTGVIRADGGAVMLTASAAAGIVNSAINMSGLVAARGVAAHDGRVALVGDGAAVQVSGAIDVSGPVGGRAEVLGQQVALTSTARIDASGAIGGGAVIVGSGVPTATAGNGSGVRRVAARRSAGGSLSAQTSVAAGARISAGATQAGDGGRVVVASRGTTEFDGVADAGGGAAGGNGGTVEISSDGRLVVGGDAWISTAAPRGRSGNWLIDPTSITVVGSGASAGSVGEANSVSGTSTIAASTIVDALAHGAVTLSASDLVDVEAPIIAATLGGAPSGLQLVATGAGGRVLVNAPILLADGSIALRAVSAIDLTGNAIVAAVDGTVWLQATPIGRITQAAGSAVIGRAVAASAANVALASFDNFAGTFAGLAVAGGLTFNETNATGVPAVGTVADPFTAQSLTGARTTAGGASPPTVAAHSASLSVDVADATRSYGAPNPAFSATHSPLLTVDAAIDAALGVGFGSLSLSTTATQTSDVGRYPIVVAFASGFLASRYQLTVTPGTLTVVPASLTVTANDAARAEGSPNPPFTASFDGFVLGQGPSVLAGALSFTTPADPASPPGVYPIAPSGLTSTNYDIRFVAGSLTVIGGPPVAPPIVVAGALPGVAVPGGFIEPFFRGRDPDTPGDAVYRTTQFENPFVENAYDRSYALGGVQLTTAQLDAAQLTPEQLGQIAPAAGGAPTPRADTTNERGGQHAYRQAGTGLDFVPVNLGSASAETAMIAAQLAKIAPTAGPGVTPPPTNAGASTASAGPGDCSAGAFLGDFWNCSRAAP